MGCAARRCCPGGHGPAPPAPPRIGTRPLFPLAKLPLSHQTRYTGLPVAMGYTQYWQTGFAAPALHPVSLSPFGLFGYIPTRNCYRAVGVAVAHAIWYTPTSAAVCRGAGGTKSVMKAWQKYPLTVVDLYAGAGGLSEGFLDAGFDVRLAVDSNPAAVETQQTNHGPRGVEVIQADLANPKSARTSRRR